MKNGKEFDYDKKKPNFDGKNVKKVKEMKKQKSDDLSYILDKSYISKNIEVTQKDSKSNDINIKKKQIKTPSEKSQKNLDEKRNQINAENIKEESNIDINPPEKKDISLPESEIISPDIPLDENKKPNTNLSKNLLENIFEKKKSEINIGIIDSVEIGLNSIMDNIHDDIQENKIKINDKKQQLNELNKDNISFHRNKSDYESLIKMQKINELNQRKKNIEKQINKVEENINLIKDEKIFNQTNKMNIPLFVIDQNIKKDKMKENKQIKEQLLSKLSVINEQVNKLIENEKEIKTNKRINIKEFLDNFEKDKFKFEEQARKFSEEKRQREQRMLNSMLKEEKKEKENIDLKNKEDEKKKERIRKNKITRIRTFKRKKKRKKRKNRSYKRTC